MKFVEIEVKKVGLVLIMEDGSRVEKEVEFKPSVQFDTINVWRADQLMAIKRNGAIKKTHPI